MGVFMVFRFAIVGKWIGGFMVVYGVYCGFKAWKERAANPSDFTVENQTLTLPTGRFSERKQEIPLKDIKHVFLLEKHAPCFMSKPVLVIETEKGQSLLPRNWFEEASDQAELALALWDSTKN